jgi:hypothetical protein
VVEDTDDTDLVLTKQKIHDPVYIGPILSEAAGEDCLLLLKFLFPTSAHMHLQFPDVRVIALHDATASRRLRTTR